MKHTYSLIHNYFLNSAYSFALFGVYAVTVAPFINNFIEFGKPNAFVGIFGFIILIAEFFALKFKLKIVRARTQLKRIEYKKQTGIDVIPTVTAGVLFGLFSRLVFQVIITMICMSSLGFDCGERKMSPEGVIAIMSVFAFEIGAITYFFMKLDIYTDIPFNKKQFRQEVQEDNEWAAANLTKELNEYSVRKEMIANIILQIFSCMLFSTFWQFINKNGITSLLVLHEDNTGALGAFAYLFPMMFAIIAIGLRPLQIGHWIESSLQAFSSKEKKKNRVIFITVGIFACAPTIIKYLEIFIFNISGSATPDFPEYLQYFISFVLFIVVLAIEIKMLEKNDPAIQAPIIADHTSLNNAIAEMIQEQNKHLEKKVVKLTQKKKRRIEK